MLSTFDFRLSTTRLFALQSYYFFLTFRNYSLCFWTCFRNHLLYTYNYQPLACFICYFVTFRKFSLSIPQVPFIPHSHSVTSTFQNPQIHPKNPTFSLPNLHISYICCIFASIFPNLLQTWEIFTHDKQCCKYS